MTIKNTSNVPIFWKIVNKFEKDIPEDKRPGTVGSGI